MRGRKTRREVIMFGWKYLPTSRSVEPALPLPSFLKRVRDRCAECTGVSDTLLEQVIATRYEPGAGTRCQSQTCWRRRSQTTCSGLWSSSAVSQSS